MRPPPLTGHWIVPMLPGVRGVGETVRRGVAIILLSALLLGCGAYLALTGPGALPTGLKPLAAHAFCAPGLLLAGGLVSGAGLALLMADCRRLSEALSSRNAAEPDRKSVV